MGDPLTWDDVVGTDKLCEMFGLKAKSDLRQLRRRNPDFPKPRKKLSPRCFAWDRRDIETWMRTHRP